MSSMSFMDKVKLTFKVLEFKFEQSRLTTSINEIVNTKKGPVKGVKRMTIWEDSYFSFEGIPYAKPPVGELRFRAPVPADPWETVRDCTTHAEKPLQSNLIFKRHKGSEDCLYLNVFTRELKPTKLRPVMVWIYGGGFQIGEASRDMYSPDFFMAKDIVLVTIAYRLGAFGFLSIDDPDVQVPGNAGLKDQILSLKWVQENIAEFGGDPNNVTIFGESAGGVSTHLCMVSEQSKGLIHRGIVMSGSSLCPWACRPKSHWAYRLAKQLGYDGEDKGSEVYKYLMQTKGPDIVRCAGEMLSKDEKHHRIMFAFGPVIEPYWTEQCILPEHPYDLMQKTWSNSIPLMIGGTSFEGLLFHPEVTRRPATLNEVRNCKNMLPIDLNISPDSDKFEDLGLQLKRAYFGDKECSPETMFQFLELESYREFWHPIYRAVLARLRHSTAPTYLYRFDFDSKDGNAIRILLCGRDVRGVCHGDDLCYLYHAMMSNRHSKDSPEGHVTRTMIDIWTNFATKSDPNCEILGAVKFEPLRSELDIKCLNISDKVDYIELPELDKLQVWNSFYTHAKL